MKENPITKSFIVISSLNQNDNTNVKLNLFLLYYFIFQVYKILSYEATDKICIKKI